MKKLTLLAASLSLLLACKTQEKAVTTVTGNGQLPASFNQREIFALSMLSNLPASTYALYWIPTTSANSALHQYRADTLMVGFAAPIIDSTLANATDCSVPGDTLKLSQWKRVWGPAVMSSNNSFLNDGAIRAYVSSASMTIFQNTSIPGNYIVGIQATNPSSLEDWKTYDFNVGVQVPWFWNGSTSGHVSEGTYLGLNALLQLTSNNNVTAVQFLDSIVKNSSAQNNIVVTGHSLGGALSPVFALFMKHQLDSIGTGNSSFNDSVYCLSTAGATPGDTTFANYYNSVLGAHSVRIWNYYDMVPRGWVPALLTPVMSNHDTGGLYSHANGSTFYDTIVNCSGKTDVPLPYIPLPTTKTINSIVTNVINTAQSAPVPYMYICNNGINFQGAATHGNTGYYVSIDSNESLMDHLLFDAVYAMYGIYINHDDFLFLSEEAAQHTSAYGMYFQTKGIHEYVKAKVQASPISTYHFTCNKVHMPLDTDKKNEKPVAADNIDPKSLIPANMSLAEFMFAYMHAKSVLY